MKEDIISMAQEAGFETDPDNVWITDGYWLKELERFAALVADRCAEIAHEAEPYHSADLIRKAFGVEK
jgi:hypothetical protein